MISTMSDEEITRWVETGLYPLPYGGVIVHQDENRVYPKPLSRTEARRISELLSVFQNGK